MRLEYFPPEAVELQKELVNHSELLEILSSLGDAPLEERIAVIAAYCGMVLDGYYDDIQLGIIFRDMLLALRKKSTVHIFSPPSMKQ